MQGSDFREGRKLLGLNQTELAQLLDVDLTTVSRWERGQPPKLAQLALEALLARAVHAYLSEVLRGNSRDLTESRYNMLTGIMRAWETCD